MRFENTDELKGVELVNVDLSGARGRNVNLQGVKIMEAMLVNARFSGLITGLVVNDVEVAPLIAAEMDRRYPERTKLRPRDADGVREAWVVIEGLWAASKARASSLPEPTLRQRVDDEWSFLETQRHLVMVTDSWVSANVLGRSGHYWPFGVLPSFMTDASPYGIDPTADPSWEEVAAAREDRMLVVRRLVADLTDADLARSRDGNTVLRCLRTLMEEEWSHNRFANRDLDVLASGLA